MPVETEGARAVDRRHADDPPRRNGGPLRDAARPPPAGDPATERWPGCPCRARRGRRPPGGPQPARVPRQASGCCAGRGRRPRRGRQQATVLGVDLHAMRADDPAAQRAQRRRGTATALRPEPANATCPSPRRPRKALHSPSPVARNADSSRRLREMDRRRGRRAGHRARSSSGDTECGAWAASRISTFGAGRGPPASARRRSASARIFDDAAGSQPISSWNTTARRDDAASGADRAERVRDVADGDGAGRRPPRRSRGRCRRPPRRP